MTNPREPIEEQPCNSTSCSKSLWQTYHLLIFLALALTAGRITVVTSREGDTAFLSANDRSRWATVACLVERGTYVIDEQIAIANPIHRNRRPWNSIDKVRHLGADGSQHYYSSKPPLLATMVAGVYWLVHQITGMTLTQYPAYVPRLILLLFNLPLLAIFFYATIATTHRLLKSDWGRQLAAASTCFGTMVLPFAISLNNHLLACTSTAVAMWIYMRDHDQAESKTGVIPFRYALLAGFAASMGAANELPALSMTALWGLIFLIKDRSTVLPFSLGCLLVAVAFFGTNWIAHQSWRPPYAHRGNGELLATLTSKSKSPDEQLQKEVTRLLRELGEVPQEGTAITFQKSDETNRWLVRNRQIQYSLLLSNLTNGPTWELLRWDDWYEYPGTYWKEGKRQGLDRGEASKSTYLMNMTIGHHGLFSITPVWALLPVGWILGLAVGRSSERWFHIAVLTASTVCFLFYLNRPLIDRNYGGVSACFRWLLWFAPLWLVTIAPVFDRLGRLKLGRVTALLLLAFSLFSVATALETPWQSPWIYRFWIFLGWIEV